jgi:hypothetical protein
MRFGWHLDDNTFELMDLLPGLAEVRIDVWDIGPDDWQFFLRDLSERLRSMRKVILALQPGKMRRCGLMGPHGQLLYNQTRTIVG